MNVNRLKRNDQGYPEPLLNIAVPPRSIYWTGLEPCKWLSRPKLAVIGSRKPTLYGLQTTEKLVRKLVRFGVVIISGLAFGIDIAAHRVALETGGTAVAVLPAGLDKIYPVSHQQIAGRISQSGSLVSEYPVGTPALKQNFVARNRLISGLADGVLVIEAARTSGSLHTVRFGLEQGRTIMAVPGDIDRPGHEGCNNLIKSGGALVTEVEDVLLALGIEPEQASERRLSGLDPEAEAIYRLVAKGTSDTDQLAVASGLAISRLNQILTSLEISGHIKPLGAGQWLAL